MRPMGSPPSSLSIVNVDSGARPPGDFDHRRACRVQADAVDLDVGAGRPRRQRDPERRARHIAGHDEVPGAQPLSADDGDGFADLPHAHAEFVKRALGVIARRHGLEHGRFSVGLQTGEEHGALDLRARDLRTMGDASEPGAVDDERRPAIVRSDGRAHLGQGPNHALHRPPGQGSCRRP